MRKSLVFVAFAAALASGGGCKQQDPNRFETHVDKIRDQGSRAAGFAGLEALVKSVVSAPNNGDRIQEFVDKVVPAFEEIWDTAPEQREPMLKILRDVGHPGASKVWLKALPLDGSGESYNDTLLALEGIKKARAKDATDGTMELLQQLVTDPRNDKGKEEGRIRLEAVEALGAIGDKKAVPLLIKVLEQTKETQPVAVHRSAAKALGEIGDPSAVDALLTAQFRVPDSPSTSDIGNRCKLALVEIGDPAVPQLMKMLRGELKEVNDLAAQHELDINVVKQSAAGILAAMGTATATEDLVAFMPKEDCAGKAELDPADGQLRAFVANALGFIGDERAVDALCGCSQSSGNPGDMWEIAQALGRIGGSKAAQCLADVVKNGVYKDDAVESPEFKHEIRWEAARFAVLAATPADLAKIKSAIDSNTDAKVKEKLAPWSAGIALVESCKDDRACYTKTLQDMSAEWFPREKAAYELARLAKGDAGVATEISKAFKVRSPDARVSMAWLPARMLEGKACPGCVEALEGVIKAEKDTMDAKMQLPVLTARYTIAKLDGGNAGKAAAAATDAPAKAAAPAPAAAPEPAKAPG